MRAGSVRVNGEVVSALGTRIDAEKDRVEVDGRRARVETAIYRLLLKPRARLSVLGKVEGKDGQRPTLSGYLADAEPHWQVAAPLDFAAEGVVLITTDGDLAQRLSRTGGTTPMTYHIKYQGKVGDEQIGRLLRGWRVDSRRTVRPESAIAIASTGKNTWVEMVIKESRPRVLKASGDPIRCSVLKISRVRLGPLSFEGLGMGDWRDLSKTEVAALRKAAGM